MKKQILFFFAVMVAGITVASAQGGPGGRGMNIEEQVARVHAKLDSAFKLDAAKLTQADSAFAQFYRARQAKMQELMSGGGERPSREAMQEAQKPLIDERDKKLGTILTADQLKIFKEQIEPSMRGGGRGPGGGGRPGQR
ncbi:MAG TPA: hypothetical protein VHM26_14370 [Chitinophagaceae bacterium]|nr:hypothetical protein [Chitinophagaceae bacterium]